MNLNTFLMRLISLGQSIQSQNNAHVCYKIGTGSCRNILLIGTRRETSIYDLHLRFALFKQDHALAINGDRFQPCEVNWLDSEPERDSSDYEEYIDDLHEIDRLVDFYKGFLSPPTNFRGVQSSLGGGGIRME
mmetsp:Transcript_33096/g.56361  ORF Transcript_33096/g.56361 Transcript_33096/m.56361 type:complete len:133 (+) Transcript_33096:166-564(+)